MGEKATMDGTESTKEMDEEKKRIIYGALRAKYTMARRSWKAVDSGSLRN